MNCILSYFTEFSRKTIEEEYNIYNLCNTGKLNTCIILDRLCIYVCIYVFMNICIYLHIERGGEGERERESERERERERDRETERNR